MSDVRLAVWHPDEAARDGVARRLRGARLVALAECNCAMLCGVGGPSPEELLRAGVSVLLIAEPCPSKVANEVYANEARRGGVWCSVVNPERYLPSRQLIRKQLDGPLGDVGMLRSHRWEPGAAAEVEGLPEPLVRDIDVALWLTRVRPDRVFAVEQRSNGGGCVQVHLGFPHGGMALLDFDNRLPAGDPYRALSVIARSGAAYADDHQNAQLLYRGGTAQAIRTDEHTGQLAAIAQEFVDALTEAREPAASSWPNVFAVARAAVESIKFGRAVGL